MLEADEVDSKPFEGVRFVLLGYEWESENLVRSKLVTGGAEDVGHYSRECTHLIVDKCVYDDPTCVAARRDGKIVVTALWVDHSYDIGVPVDHTSVMYRPLKDLDGIPGAKSLIVCLTGYQRQDRDDIMTLVGLMGARFSKPLIATRVTHLICYKFEGEKYELAKKMPKIKLVNHVWLEDCLNSWEILPETNYAKSGYELEMELEAKDSEDEEAQGSITKQFMGRNINATFDTREASAVVPEVPAAQAMSEVPFAPTAVNNFDAIEESRMLTRDTVSTNMQADCISNNDNEIGGRSSDAVMKPEPSNKSPVFKKNEQAVNSGCHEVVETVTDWASSPWTGNKNVPTDPSNSVCGAKRLPDSGIKQSNMYEGETNIPRSLPSYLPGETRNLEKLYGEHQPHVSKTEQTTKMPLENVKPCDGKVLNGTSPLNEEQVNHGEVGVKALKRTHASTPYTLGSPVVLNNDLIAVPPATGFTGIQDDATEPHPLRSQATDGLSPVCRSLNINNYLDIPPPGNGFIGIKRSSPCSNKNSSRVQNRPISENPNQKNELGNNGIKMIAQMSMKIQREDSGEVPATVVALLGRSCSDEMVVQNQQHDNVEPSSEVVPEPSKDLSDAQQLAKTDQNSKTKSLKKAASRKTSGSRLNFKSPSLCSEIEKEKEMDSKSVNPSESSTLKLKPGGRKSLGKNITGANSNSQVASHSSEFEKSDLSDMRADENGKLNLKPLKELVGAKSVGARLKSVAKSIDQKGLLSVTRKFSLESTNEQDNTLELTTLQNNSGTRQVDGSISVKGVKEGCGPRNEEGEAPENNVVSEANTLGEVTKARDSDAQQGGKNGLKKAKRGKAAAKTNAHKGKIEKKAKTLGKFKMADDGEMNVGHKDPVGVEESTMSKDSAAEDINMEEMTLKLPTSKVQRHARDAEKSSEAEKENRPFPDSQMSSKRKASMIKTSKNRVVGQNLFTNKANCYLVSGHRLQRKEFQKIIRQLKGRPCRDSHQWSYQATHFIVPEPLRRTEKFFAAAASGRWILKTEYLTDSLQAGKFLEEEPYEWHGDGVTQEGTIDLAAPRKWRLLREQTGHGALHGLRIVVYGDFFTPPLDTLKRVAKAGDGIILATSPPYTRFLDSGVDYAIVGPGMPEVDVWIQEFLKHEIPCVMADYLVDYVCKPGSPLEQHVLFKTQSWAEKSFANLVRRSEEETIEDLTKTMDEEEEKEEDIKCCVCGTGERGEEMLICGDEKGSAGCGIGTHMDCCDPCVEEIPEGDWFCSKCSSKKKTKLEKAAKKKATSIKKR